MKAHSPTDSPALDAHFPGFRSHDSSVGNPSYTNVERNVGTRCSDDTVSQTIPDAVGAFTDKKHKLSAAASLETTGHKGPSTFNSMVQDFQATLTPIRTEEGHLQSTKRRRPSDLRLLDCHSRDIQLLGFNHTQEQERAPSPPEIRVDSPKEMGEKRRRNNSALGKKRHRSGCSPAPGAVGAPSTPSSPDPSEISVEEEDEIFGPIKSWYRRLQKWFSTARKSETQSLSHSGSCNSASAECCTPKRNRSSSSLCRGSTNHRRSQSPVSPDALRIQQCDSNSSCCALAKRSLASDSDSDFPESPGGAFSDSISTAGSTLFSPCLSSHGSVCSCQLNVTDCDDTPLPSSPPFPCRRLPSDALGMDSDTLGIDSEDDTCSGVNPETTGHVGLRHIRQRTSRRNLDGSRYPLKTASSLPTRGTCTEVKRCDTSDSDTPAVVHSNIQRSSTWPPPSHKLYECLDDEDADSVFGDYETDYDTQSQISADGHRMMERLGECIVPYSNLEFKECIKRGHRCQIYRGRWHGDVIIHKYQNLNIDETSDFLREVTGLTLIRHENVVLFMGACLEPPHLALITGLRKGQSLYEQIHHERERMSLHSKVHIARQVSQALNYLHSRGVIIRKLNSKNIFMEAKVKVSVTDHSMPSSHISVKSGYGYIPAGHLSYVAPEILKTLAVDSPKLRCYQRNYSTMSDVYAFGSLLYELLAGCYPHHAQCAETVIWMVSAGRRPSLRDIHCTSVLKHLIGDCWSHDPLARPEFSEINKELLVNAGMWKRHSTSDPEKLHQTGLYNRGLFF